MIRIFLFLFSFSLFANESFVIEFNDTGIKVDSQTQKGDFTGILVRNNTFQKFIGIIKNEEEVLQRFSIRAGKTESFQIKNNEYKKLYYINMSPASETLPLIIGNKTYEIPKKR